MPRTSTPRIHWNPPAIAKLMADNGIENRYVLVERLSIGRSTVYAAFDENWAGQATDKMIAQLMTHLGADFGALIAKPPDGRKTGRKGKKS